MIHDTTPGVREGVSPLIDVLQLAEACGFAAEFEVAGDASGHEDLWCPHCEVESSASSFERAWSLRLEGASDPADMLHVSALTCPNCGTGGVFVTPFGPIASQRQACVLRALICRRPSTTVPPRRTEREGTRARRQTRFAK